MGISLMRAPARLLCHLLSERRTQALAAACLSVLTGCTVVKEDGKADELLSEETAGALTLCCGIGSDA